MGTDGYSALRLALDTGADTTVINLGVLIGLGHQLPGPAGLTTIITGSGVVYALIVVLPKIIALGQERSDFLVLGHTLPPGAGIDGVLGLDFLQGLIVTLDFRKT